jgi:hypothetical protein
MAKHELKIDTTEAMQKIMTLNLEANKLKTTMKNIIDIMDTAINDLNKVKSKLHVYQDVKYIVVKMSTSGRGVDTLEQFSFDLVEDAIALHIEKRKENLVSAYWDIVVEY